MTDITAVAAEALDEVLDLIAAEQAHPDRGTTMLGDTRDGIAAELGDVEPDWTASVRVARQDGRIVGAVVGDWDPEVGRAWILGPVGARRRRGLAPLGPAARGRRPGAAARGHRRLGAGRRRLARPDGAARCGARAVAQRGQPRVLRGRRHRRDAGRSRPGRSGTATHADVETLRPLHDQEFPASYATRRPPGARASRRQVPGPDRHGRAAAPRVRRRPGAGRRRGLPRLHRRRGRRPRPGHRTGPDGRGLPAR